MMSRQQYGFFINVERCIGCHTCEVACKETYDLELGPRWRRVRTVESGRFPTPSAYFISMACNHCEDPMCVKVCPVRAYTKRDDGLVVHNPDRCIGCRYCTYACPYEAPQFDPSRGKVGKCSGCHELVSQGRDPVCVQACIVRALEFGPMEELERRHPDAVRDLPVLPDPGVTNPSVRFRPKAAVYARPSRIIDGHRTRQV